MSEGCLGTPTHSKPMHSNCGSLDRETPETQLTRRRLVGAGLLAMGTATLVRAHAARASSEISVWGLDPDGGHEACDCTACGACRAHALNKIFASAADADAGRAHPYCKCTVAELSSVKPHVYSALFGDGGRERRSVDRRWQWVQAALAAAAPIPTRMADAPSVDNRANDRNGARVPLGTAATPTIRAAWIRRIAPRRRELFVQLDTASVVEAEIRLTRYRTTLVRRHVPKVNGRQILRIPIPVKVTRGPAQLEVWFRDATAGRKNTARRLLSVPAKQAPER
ncbi:MAG: hypothetical protein LH654_10975 [Thermoleophilia bacterium]|nr:hypothetical protein [Thermoleophilia bacterium]